MSEQPPLSGATSHLRYC